MGNIVWAGRPPDGAGGSEGGEAVGATGKNRAMPSGRSEALIDLP
jgi:hypothetical protein